MEPDLLNYIDGIVYNHLTLLNERKDDKAWQDESKDLKASIEEEIKLCNKFLDKSLKLQNVGDI